MESILIDMLNKIGDDRSRFDDGDDVIKFAHFPAMKDEIEEVEDIEQLPGTPNIEGMLDQMQRLLVNIIRHRHKI